VDATGLERRFGVAQQWETPKHLASIEESPTVRLELLSRPETLTLVRGMLVGVAELILLDPELLDDLKTAVSEACNNVVLHAYRGETGPMKISLYVLDDMIRVSVADAGVGLPSSDSEQRWEDRLGGVGLPVIEALANRTRFARSDDGGAEVQMEFDAVRDGKSLFVAPPQAAADDGAPVDMPGDALVTLSPVSLVSGVLGRLARALAAAAHFSLDRFSDVYLITDALAAHAARAASGERVWCQLTSGERRIEIAVGPFRAGTGAGFGTSESRNRASAPLMLLSDQLEVETVGEDELMRVLLIDRRS
jgi:serine/threonine-protein kinase RsbW